VKLRHLEAADAPAFQRLRIEVLLSSRASFVTRPSMKPICRSPSRGASRADFVVACLTAIRWSESPV